MALGMAVSPLISGGRDLARLGDPASGAGAATVCLSIGPAIDVLAEEDAATRRFIDSNELEQFGCCKRLLRCCGGGEGGKSARAAASESGGGHIGSGGGC